MKALLLAVFLTQEEAATDVAAARERERVARLSLEAAKSKEFYYVADVASHTLSLRLGGVALATYKLDSIDLGLPVASSAAPVTLEDLYSCVGPPREPVGSREPRQDASACIWSNRRLTRSRRRRTVRSAWLSRSLISATE